MWGISVELEEGRPLLNWRERSDPLLKDGHVLIRAAYTAVNRADLSQARGQYPPPPGESEILGLEVSGVVEGIGAGVEGVKVGDRVCSLLAGGGYAEFVTVHHKLLLPVPEDKDLQWAAAIPEVWYTAFLNLFVLGELQRDETVLIHAGASGVGTAAIQLARDAGARVIATAGDDRKLAKCSELGAHEVINYKQSDFKEVIGKEQVSLVLCPIGGAYLDPNIDVLKSDGRLVLIGLLGGTSGTLDLRKVLTKRLRIQGSTLRSKSLEEKIALTQKFKECVWPKLLIGTLNPVIDRVFDIRSAQEAHEYVRMNRSVGKVLLKV